MTVTPELEAEIVRLFRAERWKRTTIARQLGIHHSTVTRILMRQSAPANFTATKKSKIDPYLPFIANTLSIYPKLNATRLYHMVKDRGYTGGVDHFRDIIRRLRPKPTGEAFLRITTLPGEQAQADWGSFGHLQVGQAERRLLAFVMVLSWSRRIFVRFYFGDNTENFLRGHVAAFEEFGAVPREILYDNLKTAVIERVDAAIRFNPELLRLAAHYRFAPKPVPVARPTSKGKVERAIHYVRHSFFAARSFVDIDDLNEQARSWSKAEALQRSWPQDRKKTVADAFSEEQSRMLELPEDAYPVYERTPILVGKTPYVRFDGNDYSVPHRFVRSEFAVEATLQEVRLMDGINVVSRHVRTFDKGKLVECPEHVAALLKEKTSVARKGSAITRILNVSPSSNEYLKLAASRGCNMGRLTQSLSYLLEMYGSAELEEVLAEVVRTQTVHSQAISNALERRRQQRGLPPAVHLQFLKDRRIDEVTVRPKSLASYDKLLRIEENDE